jgi:dUTP pyrophosphatase
MNVYRMNPRAELPRFQTAGSACFDLKALLEVGQTVVCYNPLNKETRVPVKNISGKPSIQLYPQHRALIPTGLIFDIPEGHVVRVYPRSGNSLKRGLQLANSTGIVDSDYVEEIFVILQNTSEAVVVVEDGERISQAMLEQVLSYELTEVTERPSQKTERNGGFGSTGAS